MSPDAGGTPTTGPQPAQIQTHPPITAFNPKDVPPAQLLYLQDNDFLAFTIFTNSSPITLQLTYRYLTPLGEIKQGTTQFTTAGAINSFNLTLGECWLISFGLQRTSGGNQSVISFAQALIIRDQNTGSGQNIYGVIWQGFVQTSSGNGWPGTPAKELLDGPGNIRTIVGTTPAAGADISETVPNNRRWILLALNASLTTSAAVANRNVTAVFDDGANKFHHGSTFFAQVASSAFEYSFYPSLISVAAQDGVQPLAVIVPMPLRGGFRIKTATAAIQAADQWTAPIYSFLEWGSWDS
jgi:hypothetical protein